VQEIRTYDKIVRILHDNHQRVIFLYKVNRYFLIIEMNFYQINDLIELIRCHVHRLYQVTEKKIEREKLLI
jgi:hypothetical protein